jgi:RNA polymerase sigma-70 factor (ECF subfamily)
MGEHISNWGPLIKSAKKGEQKAVAELVNRSHKLLFVYLLHLSKNRQLAEDLTHDALLKALSSLDQLKEAEAFMGWVKAIARTQYLDWTKACANSSNHMPIDEIVNESALIQGPSVSPENIAAMRVLQMLSEEDRSVLILADIQGCSYAEVSQVLEIPEGTVKSRLFRARERFSSIYEGTNQGSRSSLEKGTSRQKRGV